ncbi:proline-rich protein 2-like [Melospiza georgiana]|uniref:proline-rich protein 2-like n=1 Tax=Melospiza georgiana TaxID=44398 RepID=UPI0025AC9E63|nr:proline-rich protein 2-like [Melospiza georgiana]
MRKRSRGLDRSHGAAPGAHPRLPQPSEGHPGGLPSQSPLSSPPFLLPSPRPAALPPPTRGRLTLAAAHTVPVPVPGARGRRTESDAPVPAHLPLRSRRSPRATGKATRQRPSASRAALAGRNKLNPRGQRWSPAAAPPRAVVPPRRAGAAGPRAAAPCGGAVPGQSPPPPRNKSPVPAPFPAEPRTRAAERARRLTQPTAATDSPGRPAQRCPRASSAQSGRCRRPPDRRQQPPRRLNAIAGSGGGGGSGGTDTAPRAHPRRRRGGG